MRCKDRNFTISTKRQLGAKKVWWIGSSTKGTKGKMKLQRQKVSKITNLLQLFGRLQVSSWLSCVATDGNCIDPVLVGGSDWSLVVTGDHLVISVFRQIKITKYSSPDSKRKFNKF